MKKWMFLRHVWPAFVVWDASVKIRLSFSTFSKYLLLFYLREEKKSYLPLLIVFESFILDWVQSPKGFLRGFSVSINVQRISEMGVLFYIYVFIFIFVVCTNCTFISLSGICSHSFFFFFYFVHLLFVDFSPFFLDSLC